MKRISDFGVLILASTMFTGCIQMVRLTDDERASLRERVQYYEGDGPPGRQVIQPIRATSCTRVIPPWTASQEDAIDQLRLTAASMGANGLANLTCDDPEGLSMAKNCWSAVTCRAHAIKVPTQ